MPKCSLLLVLIVWGWVGCIYGQVTNLGLPFIHSFSKQEYGAGTQSWGFAQDAQHNLLVANNNGLLTFNGQDWELYPLPNQTIARSIVYDSIHARIYVGGQDAFGYFAADTLTGQLRYTNLKNDFPEVHRRFGDVWQMVQTMSGSVFFRSNNKVYHWEDDVGAVYEPDLPILYLGAAYNQVYLQTQNGQLSTWKNGIFQALAGPEMLSGHEITGMIAGGPDSCWVATESGGLYIVTTDSVKAFTIQQQDYLEEQRLQGLAYIEPNQLAVGTTLSGVLLIDLVAKRITQRLHRRNGLQNNHVRSLFADAAHNLWLGLDNGIDHLALATPLRRFTPDREQEGSVYALRIHEQNLYVGNTNGLYHIPWKMYYDARAESPPFERIAGTTGQVWGLSEIENKLFLGHHEGAFSVNDSTISPLSKEMGIWEFLPYTYQEKEYLLTGGYYGLRFFQRQADGDWTLYCSIEEFTESARILAVDESQHIWVSHPYRGIYRLQPTSDLCNMEVAFYGAAQGLPSNLDNYLFALFNEIVVCAEKGVYRYNATTDRFEPHPDYQAVLGTETRVRRLIPDAAGNVWYVTAGEAGVLWFEQIGLKRKLRRERFPQLRTQLLGGFEFIYPYDEQHVFIGAEKGALLYYPQWTQADPPSVQPQLTTVSLLHEGKDSVVVRGQFLKKFPELVDFAHRHNAFRFHFTSCYFNQQDIVEYQYYLAGQEANYSEWTTKTEREYTNLPPGNYQFHLRSRLNKGEPGPVTTFSFTIAPPWYRTMMARAFYVCIALLGLFTLVLVPRRRFAREKKALLSEQKEQVKVLADQAEASARTIDQLKAEKLESEIGFKNKELASMTMHLVQKNELLQRVSEELKSLSKDSKDTAIRKRLRSLQQLLSQDESLTRDWSQFAYHFDQVHSGFFQRLREQYPQLTPKDHKLCAYLRMNLATKDIAPLLNISVRGVEISRYRLRKKLELDSEVNLTEFMMNF